MNYYERHLGDYAKDTAHLTMIEHGAYSILLDRYYATECGIPADQVHRLARARTREEKLAVDSVLSDFFELVDGFWRSKRCDMEIEKFREAEPDRSAKRENEKERQRRSRERRKAIFDALREHGIVPAYDTPMSELQAQLSRVTKRPVTQPVTRDATATQTPDTRHQIKPIASANGISTSGTPAGIVCARLKADGIPGVNPQHPKLLRLLEDGLTVDEIASIGPEAKAKGKGFAWILAAAEGRRRDAAETAALPPLPSEEWFMTASGIEAKAAEHGITKQRDEPFPAFKARVYQAAGVTDDMVRRGKIDRGERV